MEVKSESKKENSKSKSKQEWKPLAVQMGSLILHGLISGFSIQAGVFLFDKTFKRNSHNLLLLEGGKRTGTIG